MRSNVPSLRAETVCPTVDVEDWIQSTLDPEARLTERCPVNTRVMLDFFDELGLRGTWFVQGYVARDFPDLVREIADRGHEVGCHAHSHRPLDRMKEQDARDEIREAKARIEDATGARVVGFRAPDFSVGRPCQRLDELNRRIFATLAELGFEYDSSVVPARMRRYGVADALPGVFRLREGLVEVPLATAWLGARWPALGGGYLRLLPLAYHRLAMWQARRRGRVPVLYLHPYELDTSEVADIVRERDVPLRLRLTQETGRGSVRRKAARLLRGVRAITMRELVRDSEHRPLPVL